MERTNAVSITAYRSDDGPVLRPLSYFSEDELKKVSPYQIFTGVGVMATIIVPHDCDCEYCEHEYDERKLFFSSKEEMRRKLKQDYDDPTISSVAECFFARLVKQEYADCGLFGDKEEGGES